MKAYTLFIFFQICYFMNVNARECYQFIDQKILFSILENEGITLYGQDRQTLPGDRMGQYFLLPDGKVIVMYPVIGPKQGLLLDDVECLNAMLKGGRIPLDEPEPDFLTRSNHLISEPNDLFEFHNEYLKNTWGETATPFPSKEYYEYYYSKILSYYQENGRSRDEDIIAFWVVAGEKIRREVNGKWMLIQVDGIFNPYFDLYIMKNKKEYIEFSYNVLHSLMNEIPFDDYVFGQMFNFIIPQKTRVLVRTNTTFHIKE